MIATVTHRVIDRRVTMLVFERGPHKRPTSSLQLNRMGDNAMIDTLMGPGFYRLMETVGIKPFQDMGIAYIYAAVTDLHLHMLMERMPLVNVKVLRPTVVDGIPMQWIELTASGKPGVDITDSTFASL